MNTRNKAEGYIRTHGEVIERFRTWKELERAKENSLLIESTPSGYSNWFYIKGRSAIWWIYSDSSDGGSWGPNGLLVTGYKIPYKEDIAKIIKDLLREERSRKLANIPYASIK